ncbi:MAG: M24 family metallopeptidase [Sandaracinus sp.]
MSEGEAAALPPPLVSERLGEIQLAMREAKLEGWLLADHRGQNALALRALGLGPETGRAAPLRRLFYWLPSDGMPVLIAHALELAAMPELPGEQIGYASWADLRRALERTLPTRGTIAMEHATIAACPDVSRVEAGTVGLVESYGGKVVPSIDLANAYVGTLREAELLALRETVKTLAEVRAALPAKLRAGATPRDVAREARALGEERGLVLVDAMVAAGTATRSWPRAPDGTTIGEREHVLVDLFARRGLGPVVHAGFVLTRGASKVGERLQRDARAMREAAIERLEARLRKRERVLGFEVDEAARAAAAKLDRTSAIRHRTGSHVGTVPFSGEACTFDAVELPDTRAALVHHAWSVHPGLYDDDLGARAQATVLATPGGLEVLDRSPDEPLVFG